MAIKASASITLTRVNDGTNGVSVLTVDVEYYSSTSNTTQTGGSWSTSTPSWVSGRYIWSRTKTTTNAASGNVSYTNPVCITGGNGQTGVAGQGVASIVELYKKLSTKDQQSTPTSDAGWLTTPPTWSTGYYIHTCSKITYKNPTTTAYTVPVCDNSWEAVNDVQIGGRNLFKNSSLTVNADKWIYSSGLTFTEEDGRPCGTITGAMATTKLIQQSLLGALEVGQTYTMSGWVKTKNIVEGNTGYTIMFYLSGRYDNNGTSEWFGLGSKEITPNQPWTYITYTFTVDSKYATATSCNACFYTRDYTGSTYFYNFKLEKGNKATDWTPAPEDIDEAISNTEQEITKKYQSAITQEADSIKLHVSGNYSTKDDLTNATTALNTQIIQTVNDINFKFEETNTSVTDVDGKIDEFSNTFVKYIRFTADGIELGEQPTDVSKDVLTAKLTRERLSFWQAGVEVAYVSNQKMFITDAQVTNSLNIGSFAFVPRGNGNTSFKLIK